MKHCHVGLESRGACILPSPRWTMLFESMEWWSDIDPLVDNIKWFKVWYGWWFRNLTGTAWDERYTFLLWLESDFCHRWSSLRTVIFYGFSSPWDSFFHFSNQHLGNRFFPTKQAQVYELPNYCYDGRFSFVSYDGLTRYSGGSITVLYSFVR